MRLDGIIGVLMVLLAVVALIIFESGVPSMPAMWASGSHEADEILGGQDEDNGGSSAELVQQWAAQANTHIVFNASPWGPPQFQGL